MTKTGNGTTTVYHTDREGKTITETDTSGNLIADYVYVNGKLAAKKEPAALFFYHTDPAGTPLAITDSAGAIAWKADYKPFWNTYRPADYPLSSCHLRNQLW